MSQRSKNRLAGEKSPYLLQHAGNPVDWYPWCEEAFEKAAREDKPVFLSIGYAACHWCHVMERESFDDDAVAEMMNRTFVCVKVDREERPDIDGMYMTACQMLTGGGGGWPLTILMTPDKRPFFGASYLPKDSRSGRMGMLELVPRIAALWKNERARLMEAAAKVSDSLKQVAGAGRGGVMDKGLADVAYERLADGFDTVNGGFSGAPKFPVPHNLFFLLRYWSRNGNTDALRMVEATLGAMRRGGIFDHIGFGFHRYSTDERWLVPHFEKMTYDQALMAMAYTEAFQATGKGEYARAAGEVLSYLLRRMRDEGGGFYSSEDADSAGIEGAFYVWRREEILSVLGDEEGKLFCEVFNVDDRGNFPMEIQGGMDGTNILHLKDGVDGIAAKLGIPPMLLKARMEMGRTRLFHEREKRVRPARDEKVLADWNGLIIAALAKGAQAFGDTSFAREAERCAGFAMRRLKRADGRLFHRWADGDAAVEGNLDDYAFLVWGLIELYEAVFDAAYLADAVALTEKMTALFADADGGFFFTAADAETPIARRKDIYDGAIPSGNAVAMLNLLRLARFTGRVEFEESALRSFGAFAGAIAQNPEAHLFSLAAYDFALGPVSEVVIASPGDAGAAEHLLKKFRTAFLPNKVVLLAGRENGGVAELAPFTAGCCPIGGDAAAYVCRDFKCELPVTAPEKMMELVTDKKP